MVAPLVLTLLLALPGQKGDEASKPEVEDFQPDPAWKALGKSLWFDPKERRVIVKARVCLTEGALEHLLCREQTKEHESILATDAVPRGIHAALLLAGAQPGHPVQFQPKYVPASGTPIQIDLEWKQGGETRKANAKEWVKDIKAGKPLSIDWVFAGSQLFEDPETKKMIYSADAGDVITVSNFLSAMLDLPIDSSADDSERTFVANTPKIPPRGTLVTMILRPVPKPKAAVQPSPKR